MASGTRTRDWATVDFYALLGITPTAGPDEVTRAFREAAKRAHPDVARDAVEAARFSDLTAAYAVLSDRVSRRAYDQVRAGQRTLRPAAVAADASPSSAGPAGPAPVRRRPWSRRRSWTVLVAGVVLTVLGVGAGLLTWSMHEHDARLRARYLPVTAVRDDATGPSMITFVTRTGARVHVREPQQHGDPSALGPTVKVRYDPADPARVVVDDSNLGRDITFTIVALKLLVGGPVFAVLGWRRLRSAAATAAR